MKGNRIAIVDHAGSFGGDKDAAARLRERLLKPALKSGQEVVLDFRGVDYVTQSFIHALLSAVVRRDPPVLERIRFDTTHATTLVRVRSRRHRDRTPRRRADGAGWLRKPPRGRLELTEVTRSARPPLGPVRRAASALSSRWTHRRRRAQRIPRALREDLAHMPGSADSPLRRRSPRNARDGLQLAA